MKINPTPVNDPKLRAVMANLGTHKIMICQNHPESQFSSKNPYQRSIFVLTTDCKCPVSDLLVINDGRTAEDLSDEEVANLMGTTVDDQRPEEVDVIAILVEAAEALPKYGTLSLEAALAIPYPSKELGEILDAVSAYPAETIAEQFLKMRKSAMRTKSEHHNVDMAWADYADIQKLDQLFLSMSVQEYAELYHKLASQYTEDKVIYQLNQYNAGITW